MISSQMFVFDSTRAGDLRHLGDGTVDWCLHNERESLGGDYYVLAMTTCVLKLIKTDLM